MSSAVRPKAVTPASSPHAEEAISAAEFAALLTPFGPFENPRIGVAVSGGPDSMALAHLLKRWLDANYPTRAFHAFIVDHALRPESAVEAAATQQALRDAGIPAETLRWEHTAVVTRIHENARRARYQLLIDACKKHGLATLFTAHQQEDQAETILMRLAKGSGVDGLAGMAANKMLNGVRILRPLLTVPRAKLLATCEASNISYVSDPSNASQKFARGRLRRIMPLLDVEGFSIERLTDLGVRAADAKAALDYATAALLRVGTERDCAGVIEINLEHFRAAPRAIAQRALAACLRSIEPADYAPEYASLARLADALRSDTEMPACTFHGALISKGKDTSTIMREHGAISESMPIEPGQTVLWDKRWLVTLPSNAPWPLTINALGNPTHDTLDRHAPGLRKLVPQGRARATLPGLWLNRELGLIPSLPGSDFASLATARPAHAWPPLP